MMESIARTAVLPYKYLENENINERQAVRDALNTIGFATSTPLGALGRPLGYIAGMESGDIQPENNIDMVRGLITGAKGK
jgi:hypothetical protein